MGANPTAARASLVVEPPPPPPARWLPAARASKATPLHNREGFHGGVGFYNPMPRNATDYLRLIKMDGT